MKSGNGRKGETPGGRRVDVRFADLWPGLPITLGKVNYSRAHRPLDVHTHGGAMEFVYVARGSQRYTVGGAEYAVGSGELFFTRAGEPHGTSGHPEERALFYYLIVDVQRLAEGFAGYDGAEGRALCQALDALPRRVFKARPDTKKLLDGILACHGSQTPFRVTMLRNLVSAFLIQAVECGQKGDENRAGALKGVMDYIEENLGEELAMGTLAKRAGLSVPRFKAAFRKQAGLPPREYVLRRKVESAQRLLDSAGLNVTDVAYRLGFSSSQYFATVFKRYTTLSPSQYRLKSGAKRCATGR